MWTNGAFKKWAFQPANQCNALATYYWLYSNKRHKYLADNRLIMSESIELNCMYKEWNDACTLQSWHTIQVHESWLFMMIVRMNWTVCNSFNDVKRKKNIRMRNYLVLCDSWQNTKRDFIQWWNRTLFANQFL